MIALPPSGCSTTLHEYSRSLLYTESDVALPLNSAIVVFEGFCTAVTLSITGACLSGAAKTLNVSSFSVVSSPSETVSFTLYSPTAVADNSA